MHAVHPGGDHLVGLKAILRHVICNSLGEVTQLGEDLQVGDGGLAAAEKGAGGLQLGRVEPHEFGQLVRDERLTQLLHSCRLLRPLIRVPVVLVPPHAEVEGWLPRPRHVVRQPEDLLDLEDCVGVGRVQGFVELASSPPHHGDTLGKLLHGAVVLCDLHEWKLAIGRCGLQLRPVVKTDAVVFELHAAHHKGQAHLLCGSLDVEVGELDLWHLGLYLRHEKARQLPLRLSGTVAKTA
mmetsp:Transcript_22672/g.51838  ORF Transcript_22672/g.51838 Transcript_22672/m.51838 type:complete len:238 (-) Transcript_22672:7-720(-)